MMVVPVNANVQKAQCIAEKCGDERLQCIKGGLMRRFQLQHHDRDDDRDDAVTERFEARLSHSSLSSTGKPYRNVPDIEMYRSKGCRLAQHRLSRRLIYEGRAAPARIPVVVREVMKTTLGN